MKLIIDIFGFVGCAVIGFIGGYLLRMSQEMTNETESEDKAD